MKKANVKKRTNNCIMSVMLTIFLSTIFGLMFISSCEKNCEHRWKDATCTAPRTCTLCGETEGSTIEHIWKDATCTAPRTCTLCGETEGSTIEHIWKDATCIEPRTCTLCALSDGKTGDHQYSAETVIKAESCTEDGKESRVCIICSHTETKTIPAKGHQWESGTVLCTESGTCTVCGFTKTESEHKYEFVSEIKADCTNNGLKNYVCSVCKEKHTEIIEANGHTVSDDVIREEKTGEPCVFVQIKKCTVCNAEIKGDSVYYHSFVTSVSEDASCVSAGVKKLTCSECKISITETVPQNNNAHLWDSGMLTGNIRTLKCTNPGCNAQKTVIDGSAVTELKVEPSDLAAAKAIQLKNAEISFGSEAMNTLKDKVVTVASDILPKDEAKAVIKELVAEDVELLGNNPTIYDFKITAAGEAITDFGGDVTVTVPYSPAVGENIDNLAVWYINGTNSEFINAEYSNGSITFKTTHFSYYTVGHVTASDHCKLYGHTYDVAEIPPTCTTYGYTISICRYCKLYSNKLTANPYGHNYKNKYTLNDETAGCDGGWTSVYICTDCGKKDPNSITKNGNTHIGSSSIMQLSEYGFCQGGIALFTCKICGKQSSRLKTEVCCSVKAETDSDGYTVSKCEKCGSVKKYKDEIQRNVCNVTEIQSFIFISPDGTVVYEFENIYNRDEHKTVLSSAVCIYPELGCEGGVVKISICQNCGKLTTVTSQKHSYVTKYAFTDGTTDCTGGWIKSEVCDYCGKENPDFTRVSGNNHVNTTKTVNLSDYGFCYGKLKKTICTICGYTTYKDSKDSCCDKNTSTGSEANRCSICGSVKECKSTTVQDGCYYTTISNYICISSSGLTVLEYSVTVDSESHKLAIIEQEMLEPGKDCTSGIKIISKCSVCEKILESYKYNHSYKIVYALKDSNSGCDGGWTSRSVCTYCGTENQSYTAVSGTGHSYSNLNSEYKNLSEYGLCSGTILISECKICAYKNIRLKSADCCINYSGIDSNGYSVLNCGICGTVKKIKDEGGTVTCYYISSSGATILEFSYNH